MTETSPVISAENYFKKNPGSVGFPLPNVTVKLTNLMKMLFEK